MLIVSKTHDYYDVGMKLGVDKTVVYDRKHAVIGAKSVLTTKQLSRYQSNWDFAVLAFCGKFYPFVYSKVFYEEDRFIWDVEEAVKVLPKSKYHYRWNDPCIESEEGIRKFFSDTYPELESVFHEHKTPIFLFRPASKSRWAKKERYDALEINPNLKDIEFYRVKDPITAFQEIYMFISGVIGIPMVKPKPIDDKVMQASKGFDAEYSFRKPPGKRGKKQWR